MIKVISSIIKDNYYGLMMFMVALCFMGVIIMLFPLFLKKKEKKKIIDDKMLKKIDLGISIEELKEKIFNAYKKMEVARSKFDYDSLREVLVEDLYLEEEKNLKKLKEDKQRIVATNIKLQDLNILDIIKTKDSEVITANLYVSQYDYIINNKKELVRGADNDQYQIEYRIVIENDKIKELKLVGKWIKNN